MGEYIDLVEEHGSIAAASRASGIPKTTFADRLAKERSTSDGKTDKPRSTKGTHVGLTTEELLLKHSPEHKIMHAAKELPRGAYRPETEFIHAIGVTGGYRHIVERQEFSIYRGKAPGSVYYWSHPESIAAMKADGVLR